ncbi:MAG TPA: amino acid ABC transporter substrate-binding protein [Alphaproteobacteria bacterium]|nr:amino acid ABC transporter substrate-binding protein [Alphaproteobacteria bacterium]
MIRIRTGLLALCATLAAGAAHAGATLDAIKQKGFVQCGVNTDAVPGFSAADSQGNWTGLDVDYCRAVAAAVLGDGQKVKFTPLNAQQRFTALQSGEIDVLSRNTTWTLTRDGSLGLHFVGVTYYDGQGFMVKKELGLKSATELDGAAVCVQSGTTTELNMADYFRAIGKKFSPVVFESQEEAVSAFFGGRCDAYTGDASTLASIRSVSAKNPDDYVILPEIISKEPLGPSVRRGDDEWFAVNRWVLYALIEAEEKGITQANVEEMRKSQDPVVQRLLGTTGELGSKTLGLSNDFAASAIKAVGNYGEIFERNVGRNTPLKLDRGLNALWHKGGLLYAMPLR